MSKIKIERLRKNLSFSSSEPDELKTFNFLENCGKRATAITTLALKEFIEKYNLNEKDKEYLSTFICHYDMFKDDVASTHTAQEVSSPIAEMPVPKIEAESPELAADKLKANKLRDMANLFMPA